MGSVLSHMMGFDRRDNLEIIKTTDGLVVKGIYHNEPFTVTMKINPNPRKPVRVNVKTSDPNPAHSKNILEDVMLSLEHAGILNLQFNKPSYD
jgi:hypothetical protein